LELRHREELAHTRFGAYRIIDDLCPWIFGPATFDVQRDTDPAYNHDRGPVLVYSIRLHTALGLKPWLRQ
jgi:hypothetical protein